VIRSATGDLSPKGLRNQQVAGSSPAAGSRHSTISEATPDRRWALALRLALSRRAERCVVLELERVTITPEISARVPGPGRPAVRPNDPPTAAGDRPVRRRPRHGRHRAGPGATPGRSPARSRSARIRETNAPNEQHRWTRRGHRDSDEECRHGRCEAGNDQEASESPHRVPSTREVSRRRKVATRTVHSQSLDRLVVRAVRRPGVNPSPQRSPRHPDKSF
jgi:hypothetical protein